MLLTMQVTEMDLAATGAGEKGTKVTATATLGSATSSNQATEVVTLPHPTSCPPESPASRSGGAPGASAGKPDGFTALHVACRAGDEATARLLLQARS